MYSFYESIRSKKFGRTSSNMYLQFKWDTENYANHRYNVKTAKSRIDDSAPLTFTHMFIRPKKMQLELERYSTIQRNNRFLLERLATVQREGAWIDNKNSYEGKTLNTWRRQQEMIHLAYHNQIMLARLQDVNAQHNRTKLEDEYLINQKYKANIRKFPPNWREVQQHLNHTKAHIFKKVFDLKYQTKAYRKSRKQALQRWAVEKEKHADAKAQKDAREAADAEKQEQLEKDKRKKAAKEREKALQELEESKRKWRAARDERIKAAEEDRKQKQEEEKRKNKAIQEREKKRREMEKEKLIEWRNLKKMKENVVEKEQETSKSRIFKKANEKSKTMSEKEKIKEAKEQEANKTVTDRFKRKGKEASSAKRDSVSKIVPTRKIMTETNIENESSDITDESGIRDSVTAFEVVSEDNEKGGKLDASVLSSAEVNEEYKGIPEVDTASVAGTHDDESDTSQVSTTDLEISEQEGESSIPDSDTAFEGVTEDNEKVGELDSSVLSSAKANEEYEDIPEVEAVSDAGTYDDESDTSQVSTTDQETSEKKKDGSEGKNNED